MSLPPLLIALLAGYLIFPFLEIPPPQLPAAAAGLLLALAAVTPRRWRLVPACAGMLLLALSLAAYALRPPDDPDALQRFAGGEALAVTGAVLEVGRSSGGRLSYDLEVERLVNRGLEVPARGKLRLYLEAPQAPFQRGDRLCFSSRLRRPRLFGTPGEFDTVRFLARRGIFTLASVRQVEEIALLGEGSGRGVLEEWRRKNALLIREALPGRPELAGLVRALAQGERCDVLPEERERLAATGMAHLFAISGLHFGLVAAALFGIGVWLWRRSPRLLERATPRRLLPLVILPLLYGYLVFSGAAVSSWRAFLGLAAAAVVVASLRRVDPLRALAAAALVLLLVDPLMAYEAAFQLSFLAAAGILTVMGRFSPRLHKLPPWKRWPLTLVTVNLAATLATLPVVLWHFGRFAPCGLLLNLVAVPLVAVAALPLAAGGVLAGLFWPAAARLCFAACGEILGLLLSAGTWLTGLPGLAPLAWHPTPRQWLAAALLAAAPFLAVAVRDHRWRWSAVAVCLAACVFSWLPGGSAKELEVTVLSVGQGEALLLSFAGGRHVLVDAGGFAGSDYDVGARLVVPALSAMGVTRLEMAVLTHDHPDHMLGLGAVLESFPTDELWTAVAFAQLPESVRQQIDRGCVRLRRPRPGWQELGESKLAVHLFMPLQQGGSNDCSLVVYAQSGEEGDGVLLSGDLEARGVAQLLADPPPGPVTLFKLPHHGSRHSSQQRLLDAFSPRLGLVSAGIGNRYGHPSAETVALYARAGVPLWRTDLHGSLKALADYGRWRVTQWKNGRFVDMPKNVWYRAIFEFPVSEAVWRRVRSWL